MRLEGTTKNWRFYGRRSELHKLDAFVRSNERFSTLAIRGRRKVGKTALMNEYRQMHRDTSDSRALVICPLQKPIQGTHRFHENLRTAIQITDPSLLDGYVPSNDPHDAFTRMAYHILEKGHILILDEFQRIGYDGSQYLESVFQEQIDRLGDISTIRPEVWHPRLIVMGSEQQKLWEMFNHPTAPMYQQIWHSIHVKPWSFAELKEVVADQGWNKNVNRLLTLWTAYNGLPGHWERFAWERHLSNFSQILNDEEWSRQFLKMEDLHRTSPNGPFHSQMEVELRPSDLALVRWLASRPSGYSIDTDLGHRDHRQAFNAIKTALQKEQPDENISDTNILDKSHDAIRKRLSGEHLGLLDTRSPLDSASKTKWFVCDNFARFQLNVFKTDNIDDQWAENENEIIETDRLADMRTLEGLGLETFVANGLRTLFETGTDVIPSNQARRTWIRTHVEREGIAGDLDVMVIHQEKHPTSPRNYDGNRNFWIGSVKRTASEFYRSTKDKDCHRTTALQRDIKRVNLFLQPINHGTALALEHFKKNWCREVNFIIISRSFSDADRKEITQEIVEIFKFPQKNSDRNHGIDRVFMMSIDDIMSGRGPQLLNLDL